MAEILREPPPMDPQKPATMESSLRSRLIGVLEDQPVLETAQAKINRAIRPVVDWADRTGVMDVLHGRQVGHALHPIATDATIGFWTSAIVLDFAGMRKAARFLTGAGNVSALVTAASGTADWTVTDGRERRLGLLHGLMNVAGLACQTVAVFSSRRYRSWSLAGYGISMAAAYIGGELVYDRALMVNHDAWLAGPSDWKPACRLSDIPDGLARGVEIDGRKVLVHRSGLVASAMENACAHLGGPLDEGEIAGGVVTCPWHGSRFRLSDGALIKGPSCFPQLRLEARVRDEMVEVRGRAG